MDYKKMSYISGIIIFFGIVIILLSIVWLSTENIFFTRDYPLFVKFPEVTGLRDQSPVFLRGYRIGTTKGVTFEPDGILIRMEINKKYQIPKGSKFEVSTLNLIGEKGISITPADTSTEFMKPGESVMGQNKDIMIMAQNLLTTMKRQIESQDVEGRVKKLGESIDLIHSSLTKLSGKIDQINIEEYNQEIKQIGEAGRQMQQFIATSQPEVLDVTREGKEVLGKMNAAIDHFSDLTQTLDTIAGKINEGDGTVAELLNRKEYIKNLDETITELRMLIMDLQKNPRKYIKVSIF